MESEARASGESSVLWALRMIENPALGKRCKKCFSSIIKNFFYLQYKQAFFKRRPVVRSDHPLDEKIPFTPGKVNIYLDFIAYWLRAAGFLISRFGDKGLKGAGLLVDSIGEVYKRAAEVYSIKFSTTKRPRYFARVRFVTIHAFDPHLMCIPSLHVMVIIETYTLFRKLLHSLGEAEIYSDRIEEMRLYGMAIVDAVLYIKQHSVNCIAASMYAMARFDPELFPPPEAERFIKELFKDGPLIPEKDRAEIREHIHSLYRRFLSEGENAPDWKEPLSRFLDSLPPA